MRESEEVFFYYVHISIYARPIASEKRAHVLRVLH